MGFFFTLFYIFTAYIGAPILFGNLVQYHIEIFIAMLTMLCSIPFLPDSELLDKPQTWGVIALCVGVALSMFFSGWAGGAADALSHFIPGAVVFFFIAVNCRKKIHLQILVALLIMVALYTIFRGFEATRVGNSASPYVISMKNNLNEDFYRIRGVTFLNDPNDFGQFVVALIPCVFFLWAKGKTIRNVLIVYLPISLLLWGMYLTHSRGGMLALMVAAMVAGRRKLGLIKSGIVGVLFFVGMSLAGFAGGRSVDADAGADRMDAWATGLGLIRAHPIFGVGYGRFTDFHPITAHNTVVVCAAELGMVGFLSWMVLVLPTVRDAYVGSKLLAPGDAKDQEDQKESQQPRGVRTGPSSWRAGAMGRSAASATVEKRVPARPVTLAGTRSLPVPAAAFAAPGASGSPPVAAYAPRFGDMTQTAEQLPAEEIRRLSNIVLISLTGFLAAGWFLSRAYEMTIFLVTGITAVVYRMGIQQGIVPSPMKMGKAIQFSLIACVGFIVLVWIILRADHL